MSSSFLSLMLLQVPDLPSIGDAIWTMIAVPIVVILIMAVLGLLIRTAAKRYVKVAPDKALVLYGKGETTVVSGGAVMVWPILYDHSWLDLRVFQFELVLKGVPNADRVPINIKAVATCKISNRDDLLKIAASAFGTDEIGDIQEKVRNALEGHLRVIIGQIDMETILSKRDEFNRRIQTEAAQELESLGCEIKILNIQEVSDDHGYIEALGKPKAAEVRAEAAIKEAEQERRKVIETTNAQRLAETTRAENDAKIAEAQRDRDIKKAQYEAEVARETAKAKQSGPLADAEARKAVVKAEVDVDKEKTLSEIDLQKAVEQKTEAELKATVLKKAEAEKERLSTEAEGKRRAAIIEAEGDGSARKIQADATRAANIAEGEGLAQKVRLEGTAKAEVAQKVGEAEAKAEQAKLIAQAEGQKAQAEAEKALLLARAEGKKAEADAERAHLVAQADGTKQMLLAQANGMKELMAAYADLTLEQRQLVQTRWLLDALPGMIEKMGEAGEKIMGEIAQSVTASLGQIDNLSVYDSGAANGHDGALRRIAKVGPDTIFEMIQLLKASGTLDVVQGLFNRFGVDLTAGPGQTGTNSPPTTATDKKGN